MATENRLIYLEDAIEKIVNFPSKVAHDAFYGRKQFTPLQMLTVLADRQHEILDLLEMVKEVDAVEVVRCKDCKRRMWDEVERIYWCPVATWSCRNDDGFCAWGERKDND